MSKNRLGKLQLIQSKETNPSGKVIHDARGNAVWDWDIETGVLARKSVSELLTSLDTPGVLSLDGEADRANANDWAGDPYNRTAR